MFGRLILATALISTLSGCTFSVRSPLKDYQGADAARLRVGAEGQTALRIYEKQGDCYKRIVDSRITAGVTLMGFPLSGSKSVGMPSSSKIVALSTNEFKLKPGQFVKITHWYHNDHGGDEHRDVNFIPEANKDYEVIIKGSQFQGDFIDLINLAAEPKIVNWPEHTHMCPLGTFEW